ncbi:lytic transglycosylase domain-containing protein [Anaeromyxobacter paludicola]|uniref:Transglycosylase SLT domain-containing protein n=1 Tax=Anaeromyxobacter paludicola TaxID=2918171 RepID=A0ABM7X533_9BACT|nr:lytic transglycosylase domain-containing protein [Anaeromyxobacter paludicola]BDG06897.1 hypothetical protein AMPC_00100 [Anaeromyxobacter paludicola]
MALAEGRRPQRPGPPGRRPLSAGVLLAAAGLAGCAGPRAAGPRSFFDPAPAPLARAAVTPAREAAPPAPTRILAGPVDTHVAARMPGQSAAARGRLTRAILGEAERARIDPLLVLAVIHVESSFAPGAVSRAGAVGLMQLREPTMRGEVARSGLASGDRRDPVANVRAGVRYLRRMLDAFGDDLELALMAYNAGPERIRRLQLHGALSKRYRAYARRVRAELGRLRARLAAPPAAAPGEGAGPPALASSS